MTKTIALLGSTGSIGRQTLEVVRELKLRVVALAAHSSTANITDLSTEPIRLRDNVVKRAEIKANVLRMKQPF